MFENLTDFQTKKSAELAKSAGVKTKENFGFGRLCFFLYCGS
jgi:hypothetical protein